MTSLLLFVTFRNINPKKEVNYKNRCQSLNWKLNSSFDSIVSRKIAFVSTKNKTLKKGCKLDAHSPFDLI